jgi:transposase InsO family protein
LRGRKKRTTRRDKHAAPAPDLVKRNFCATAPDKLWTADITYVVTQEVFVYLAFILDVYSRRKVIGWSMASHLRTELVVDALEMAIWRRRPAAGLIHHTDRGAHRVHGSLTRQEVGGGRDSPFDGKGGVGFGQRHLRIFRGESED